MNCEHNKQGTPKASEQIWRSPCLTNGSAPLAPYPWTWSACGPPPPRLKLSTPNDTPGDATVAGSTAVELVPELFPRPRFRLVDESFCLLPPFAPVIPCAQRKVHCGRRAENKSKLTTPRTAMADGTKSVPVRGSTTDLCSAVTTQSAL
jgi:hypothetical protein